MVRETRYLLVGNLPEKITEDGIIEYFKRYGKIQSVKVHPKENDGGGRATVAFTDIKSASKAHNNENRIENNVLRTDYSEGSATGSAVTRTHEAGQIRGSYPHSTISRGPSTYANRTKGSATSEHAEEGESTYPRDREFHYARGSNESTPTQYENCFPAPYNDDLPQYPSRGRPRERGFAHKKGSFQKQFERNSGQRTGGQWHAEGQHRTYEQFSLEGSEEPVTTPVAVHSTTPSGSKHGSRRRTHKSSVSRSRSRSCSKSRSSSSSSYSGSSSSSSASQSRSRSRASSHSSQRPQVLVASTAQKVPQRHESQESTSSEKTTALDTQGSDGEKRPVGICITGLPLRSSDTSLRDGLFHEYKKYGKITALQVLGQGEERYAILSFRKHEDAAKALDTSQEKLFFGTKIKVSSHEGLGNGLSDLDDNEFRPPEAELDEYHPKATRTLFVGNLEKDISMQELREKFSAYGEIIDIDIKRQGAVSAYAFVQYSDISSVVKSLRMMEGEHMGTNKIKLGFGKSMPTSCVWLDNIADTVTENFLCRQFSRFNGFSHVVVDRVLGRGLVFFSNMESAQFAVNDMRNRVWGSKKVQIDFASRDCQNSFFEKMEKTGQVAPGQWPDQRRGWQTTDPPREETTPSQTFEKRGSFQFGTTRARGFQRANSRARNFRNRGRGAQFQEEFPNRRQRPFEEEEYEEGSTTPFAEEDSYAQELREYGHRQKERRESGVNSDSYDDTFFEERSNSSQRGSREFDRFDETFHVAGSPVSDRGSSYPDENRYEFPRKSSGDDKFYQKEKYSVDREGRSKDRSHDHSPESGEYSQQDGHKSRSKSPSHSKRNKDLYASNADSEHPAFRGSRDSSPMDIDGGHRKYVDYKKKLGKSDELLNESDKDSVRAASLWNLSLTNSSLRKEIELRKAEERSSRKRSYDDMLSSKKSGKEESARKSDSRRRTIDFDQIRLSDLKRDVFQNVQKLKSQVGDKSGLKSLYVDNNTGSPVSTGSPGNSDQGSLTEMEMAKLHREKQLLLQKLKEIEETGSTSDNESMNDTEDTRKVVSKKCRLELSAPWLAKSPKSSSDQVEKMDKVKGIDSKQSYRKQMDVLRKIEEKIRVGEGSKDWKKESGEESDPEHVLSVLLSPKDLPSVFKPKKRKNVEEDVGTKGRTYRVKRGEEEEEEIIHGNGKDIFSRTEAVAVQAVKRQTSVHLYSEVNPHVTRSLSCDSSTEQSKQSEICSAKIHSSSGSESTSRDRHHHFREELMPPIIPVGDDDCPSAGLQDPRHECKKEEPISLPLPKFAQLSHALSPASSPVIHTSPKTLFPDFQKNKSESPCFSPQSSSNKTQSPMVSPTGSVSDDNSQQTGVSDLADAGGDSSQYKMTSEPDPSVEDLQTVKELFQHPEILESDQLTDSESDLNDTAESPDKLSFEDRIRRLDEQLSMIPPPPRKQLESPSSITPSALSLAAVVPPQPPAATLYSKFRIRRKEPTGVTSGDMKEPSDIMKAVLARCSIFDQDSKRLREINQKYEPKEVLVNMNESPKTTGLGVRTKAAAKEMPYSTLNVPGSLSDRLGISSSTFPTLTVNTALANQTVANSGTIPVTNSSGLSQISNASNPAVSTSVHVPDLILMPATRVPSAKSPISAPAFDPVTLSMKEMVIHPHNAAESSPVSASSMSLVARKLTEANKPLEVCTVFPRKDVLPDTAVSASVSPTTSVIKKTESVLAASCNSMTSPVTSNVVIKKEPNPILSPTSILKKEPANIQAALVNVKKEQILKKESSADSSKTKDTVVPVKVEDILGVPLVLGKRKSDESDITKAKEKNIKSFDLKTEAKVDAKSSNGSSVLENTKSVMEKIDSEKHVKDTLNKDTAKSDVPVKETNKPISVHKEPETKKPKLSKSKKPDSFIHEDKEEKKEIHQKEKEPEKRNKDKEGEKKEKLREGEKKEKDAEQKVKKDKDPEKKEKHSSHKSGKSPEKRLTKLPSKEGSDKKETSSKDGEKKVDQTGHKKEADGEKKSDQLIHKKDQDSEKKVEQAGHKKLSDMDKKNEHSGHKKDIGSDKRPDHFSHTEKKTDSSGHKKESDTDKKVDHFSHKKDQEMDKKTDHSAHKKDGDVQKKVEHPVHKKEQDADKKTEHSSQKKEHHGKDKEKSREDHNEKTKESKAKDTTETKLPHSDKKVDDKDKAKHKTSASKHEKEKPSKEKDMKEDKVTSVKKDKKKESVSKSSSSNTKDKHQDKSQSGKGSVKKDQKESKSSKNDCEKSSKSKDDCEKSSKSKDDCEKSSKSKDDCEKSSKSKDDCEKSSKSKDNPAKKKSDKHDKKPQTPKKEMTEMDFFMIEDTDPYVSMYDKVKRRSNEKDKEREMEDMKKRLSQFQRLQESRKKRSKPSKSDETGSSFPNSDEDNDDSDLEFLFPRKAKQESEEPRKKRKYMISSSSDDMHSNDEDISFEKKSIARTPAKKAKKMLDISSSDSEDEELKTFTSDTADEQLPKFSSTKHKQNSANKDTPVDKMKFKPKKLDRGDKTNKKKSKPSKKEDNKVKKGKKSRKDILEAICDDEMDDDFQPLFSESDSDSDSLITAWQKKSKSDHSDKAKGDKATTKKVSRPIFTSDEGEQDDSGWSIEVEKSAQKSEKLPSEIQKKQKANKSESKAEKIPSKTVKPKPKSEKLEPENEKIDLKAEKQELNFEARTETSEHLTDKFNAESEIKTEILELKAVKAEQVETTAEKNDSQADKIEHKTWKPEQKVEKKSEKIEPNVEKKSEKLEHMVEKTEHRTEKSEVKDSKIDKSEVKLKKGKNKDVKDKDTKEKDAKKIEETVAQVIQMAEAAATAEAAAKKTAKSKSKSDKTSKKSKSKDKTEHKVESEKGKTSIEALIAEVAQAENFSTMTEKQRSPTVELLPKTEVRSGNIFDLKFNEAPILDIGREDQEAISLDKDIPILDIEVKIESSKNKKEKKEKKKKKKKQKSSEFELEQNTVSEECALVIENTVEEVRTEDQDLSVSEYLDHPSDQTRHSFLFGEPALEVNVLDSQPLLSPVGEVEPSSVIIDEPVKHKKKKKKDKSEGDGEKKEKKKKEKHKDEDGIKDQTEEKSEKKKGKKKKKQAKEEITKEDISMSLELGMLFEEKPVENELPNDNDEPKKPDISKIDVFEFKEDDDSLDMPSTRESPLFKFRVEEQKLTKKDIKLDAVKENLFMKDHQQSDQEKESIIQPVTPEHVVQETMPLSTVISHEIQKLSEEKTHLDVTGEEKVEAKAEKARSGSKQKRRRSRKDSSRSTESVPNIKSPEHSELAENTEAQSQNHTPKPDLTIEAVSVLEEAMVQNQQMKTVIETETPDVGLEEEQSKQIVETSPSVCAQAEDETAKAVLSILGIGSPENGFTESSLPIVEAVSDAETPVCPESCPITTEKPVATPGRARKKGKVRRSKSAKEDIPESFKTGGDNFNIDDAPKTEEVEKHELSETNDISSDKIDSKGNDDLDVASLPDTPGKEDLDEPGFGRLQIDLEPPKPEEVKKPRRQRKSRESKGQTPATDKKHADAVKTEAVVTDKGAVRNLFETVQQESDDRAEEELGKSVPEPGKDLLDMDELVDKTDEGSTLERCKSEPEGIDKVHSGADDGSMAEDVNSSGTIRTRRGRKPKNYREMNSGIVPRTTSPRSRTTSPRSPRNTTSSPKLTTSPKQQSSPKSADLQIPHVKLTRLPQVCKSLKIEEETPNRDTIRRGRSGAGQLETKPDVQSSIDDGKRDVTSVTVSEQGKPKDSSNVFDFDANESELNADPVQPIKRRQPRRKKGSDNTSGGDNRPAVASPERVFSSPEHKTEKPLFQSPEEKPITPTPKLTLTIRNPVRKPHIVNKTIFSPEHKSGVLSPEHKPTMVSPEIKEEKQSPEPKLKSPEYKVGLSTPEHKSGMLSPDSTLNEQKTVKTEHKLGMYSPDYTSRILSPEHKLGLSSPDIKPELQSPEPKPGFIGVEHPSGILSPEHKLGILSPEHKPGILSPEHKPGILSPEYTPALQNIENTGVLSPEGRLVICSPEHRKSLQNSEQRLGATVSETKPPEANSEPLQKVVHGMTGSQSKPEETTPQPVTNNKADGGKPKSLKPPDLSHHPTIIPEPATAHSPVTPVTPATPKSNMEQIIHNVSKGMFEWTTAMTAPVLSPPPGSAATPNVAPTPPNRRRGGRGRGRGADHGLAVVGGMTTAGRGKGTPNNVQVSGTHSAQVPIGEPPIVLGQLSPQGFPAQKVLSPYQQVEDHPPPVSSQQAVSMAQQQMISMATQNSVPTTSSRLPNTITPATQASMITASLGGQHLIPMASQFGSAGKDGHLRHPVSAAMQQSIAKAGEYSLATSMAVTSQQSELQQAISRGTAQGINTMTGRGMVPMSAAGELPRRGDHIGGSHPPSDMQFRGELPPHSSRETSGVATTMVNSKPQMSVAVSQPTSMGASQQMSPTGVHQHQPLQLTTSHPPMGRGHHQQGMSQPPHIPMSLASQLSALQAQMAVHGQNHPALQAAQHQLLAQIQQQQQQSPRTSASQQLPSPQLVDSGHQGSKGKIKSDYPQRPPSAHGQQPAMAQEQLPPRPSSVPDQTPQRPPNVHDHLRGHLLPGQGLPPTQVPPPAHGGRPWPAHTKMPGKQDGSEMPGHLVPVSMTGQMGSITAGTPSTSALQHASHPTTKSPMAGQTAPVMPGGTTMMFSQASPVARVASPAVSKGLEAQRPGPGRRGSGSPVDGPRSRTPSTEASPSASRDAWMYHQSSIQTLGQPHLASHPVPKPAHQQQAEHPVQPSDSAHRAAQYAAVMQKQGEQRKEEEIKQELQRQVLAAQQRAHMQLKNREVPNQHSVTSASQNPDPRHSPLPMGQHRMPPTVAEHRPPSRPDSKSGQGHAAIDPRFPQHPNLPVSYHPNDIRASAFVPPVTGPDGVPAHLYSQAELQRLHQAGVYPMTRMPHLAVDPHVMYSSQQHAQYIAAQEHAIMAGVHPHLSQQYLAQHSGLTVEHPHLMEHRPPSQGGTRPPSRPGPNQGGPATAQTATHGQETRGVTSVPVSSQSHLVAARPLSEVPAHGDGSLLGLLQHYPVMWQGMLGLKNEECIVQMHFISGLQQLVKLSLPQPSGPKNTVQPLRISQRMRLEQAQLEGVAKRMQLEKDYCMLLALPCGRDHNDIYQQTRAMSSGFIQYLQAKQAAGIVNVADPGSQQPAYVVHIFPPCEFSNATLGRLGFDLLQQVRDLAHLLIIIATVA